VLYRLTFCGAGESRLNDGHRSEKEVKTQPAKTAQVYEKANNFWRCVKGAKSDQKSLGKLRHLAISLNNHKDAATPEAVCEVLSR
jgi:hypothetical protein